MMEQIAKALNKFQSDLPKVDLDATVKVQTKTGGSYNFRYATLAHIIKSVLPSLVENGLSFSQTFYNGSLCTTLYHVSGEKIESRIPLNTDSGSMQEIGSRISYLKRYSLTAMLGIVGEEDDDANISDGNAFTKKETKAEHKAGEMTPKQWAFIKKLGTEGHGLTEDELVDMIKWVAEENNTPLENH